MTVDVYDGALSHLRLTSFVSRIAHRGRRQRAINNQFPTHFFDTIRLNGPRHALGQIADGDFMDFRAGKFGDSFRIDAPIDNGFIGALRVVVDDCGLIVNYADMRRRQGMSPGRPVIKSMDRNKRVAIAGQSKVKADSHASAAIGQAESIGEPGAGW